MSYVNPFLIQQYIQFLRRFLQMFKAGFFKTADLVSPSWSGRGRHLSYPAEAVARLEELANAKSASAEALDTSLGQRYALARDFLGVSNAAVARKMGVSRELTRCWGAGINRPTNLEKLAKVLEAPVAWLEFGGSENLPANSHLGRRFGLENGNNREALFGETQGLICRLPDDISEVEIQQAIETAVFTMPNLSVLARRAGGRWQLVDGELKFAPWIPPAPKPQFGLMRRVWPDETEVIIAEKLAEKTSVYAAWHAIKARCVECGLAYPTKIALYKRLEKAQRKEEKLGISFKLEH